MKGGMPEEVAKRLQASLGECGQANPGPDRPVTDSSGDWKGGPGLHGRCSKGRGWRLDPKTAEAEWCWGTGKMLRTRTGQVQVWGLHWRCTEDCGEDRGDQPEVRGSSGELTEVRPVVEAASEASLDGNSNLEVGSGKNPGWCVRGNAARGCAECQGSPATSLPQQRPPGWALESGERYSDESQWARSWVGALEQDLDMMK
ncbi:hypothetical protein BKA82DRAFT_4012320 [Pisolithus tinctorius]|nr:hypothetical protein BKA82DRAFT_4012320 [Pisolithus tinctorius]